MMVECQHHNYPEGTENFKDSGSRIKDQKSFLSLVFFLATFKPLALLSKYVYTTPNPMLPHSFPSLLFLQYWAWSPGLHIC